MAQADQAALISRIPYDWGYYGGYYGSLERLSDALRNRRALRRSPHARP